MPWGWHTLTAVTMISTMTIVAMKNESHPEERKLAHSQKSNKVQEAQCLLNTQTKVVQENRSRESGLKVGNQRNLITTQMSWIITEILTPNRNILKKRVDGDLFSIEADAICHMALRTSVVLVRAAHMVVMSVKSSNLEETEMYMH